MVRSKFTTPVLGDNRAIRMPPSTTHEIKWGMYRRFCTSRLYPSTRTSFKSSANRMGTGKPNTRLYTFKSRVLRSTRQKSVLSNSSRKFFSPTQSLPRMPSAKR
ncbi:hypothetical protein D3C71_1971680 [compost metagenome]